MQAVSVPPFLLVVLCVLALAFVALAIWVGIVLWQGVREENNRRGHCE